MRETITAWITKFALTEGVFACQVEVEKVEGGEFVRDMRPGFSQYFHKGAWHRTYEEAKLRVLEMIRSKRRSINKQIAKLDKLESETLQ